MSNPLGRAKAAAVALVVFLSLSGGALATATTTNGFQIQNQGTQTCMTSLGGGVGAELQLYSCNGSANQSWIFANDYKSLLNTGDGLCMSDLGDQGNYTTLSMQKCDGSANQHIYYYALDLVSSQGDDLSINSNYCLTSDGNSNNGAPVYEYACKVVTNQWWYGS